MKKKVLVSVIVPVYKGGKYIQGILDSVLKSRILDFEILVVDDGTNKEDKKILASYEKEKRVRIIDLNGNYGPARARNVGVRKSFGKYIFFLDVDTKVKIDVFKIGVSFFERNESVGVIQARLLREDGKIDTAGHFLSFLGFPYEIGVGEEKSKHGEERLIFGARSAGMMIKRKAFLRAGGFDEDYLIYGEETDLCWRVWLAGYEVFYVPSLEIWHFGKSSMGKETRVRVAYEGAKNNLNYLLKNGSGKMLWWMIPGHVLGWLVLGFKFLPEGRWKMSWGVARGLFWNCLNIFKTIKKRRMLKKQRKKNTEVEKYIFGDLGFWDLLVKGFSWFKHV